VATLQGGFTSPQTKAVYPNATLVIDDIVVSLRGQLAALHYSIYVDPTALAANADPVKQGEQVLVAPRFANLVVSGTVAGSWDTQIRLLGYQSLQLMPVFSTWTIVP